MKAALRKQIKDALACMSASEVADRSSRACRFLVGLEEFRAARVVMLYMTVPSEVDTAAIALAAWQDDKTVLAPRVSWEHKHMQALEIRSLQTGLVTGQYDIREPEMGEPWPIEDIDFIVVPALAFDRRGHRLGRGGGFYDRFLASPLLNATVCGLGFREQLLQQLPNHEHDRPVGMLVTDREVLRFQRQQ